MKEKEQQQQQNDMLKIGELPELHIVAVEDVVLHEDPDIDRVARLVERFSADGVLKNPLVVARKAGKSKPIVLDGANRLTALKKLGIPHVLAQIIDLYDEGLVINCWHHAIEYLGKKELLSHAGSTPGVTVVTGEGSATQAPDYLCRLEFPDGEVAVLKGSITLMERVEQLHRFTEVYHRFAYLDRVSYMNIEHLSRNYRNFSALVSFSRFTKEDLISMTDGGVRVPSGITRVLLPKRALRFNLQLETLRSSLSLAEKEEWLQETIREKVAEKSIRFYREPTFFFDE